MTRKEALQAMLDNIKAGDTSTTREGLMHRAFDDNWLHVFGILMRKSLDAAKSLHEALRPEWRWSIHQPSPGVSRVSIAPWSILRPVPYTAEDPDPAVAWLIAIVTGEIARCE